MLTVGDLRAFIKNMRDDTPIIIEEKAIHSAVISVGKFNVKGTNLEPTFRPNVNGTDKVLQFLRYIENADGVIRLTPI